MEMQRLLDGSLPMCAWPGGYPLAYVTPDAEVLCSCCANRREEEPGAWDGCDLPTQQEVNWEDAHLYCDGCSERIPSAYAEEDNDNA